MFVKLVLRHPCMINMGFHYPARTKHHQQETWQEQREVNGLQHEQLRQALVLIVV